ncbi:ABC transporter ATP-binding protein [Myxococcota bacterium]|nr:ABC transporter ATP-binding protein [Myxococcota bacterium]MBU1897112.1 ABC transporter ATP-binding protein [Myxococcota bacterium]
MAELIARLRQVVKSYPLGRTTVEALKGVDLDLERGAFAAIAGPSGSGKTTLLNLLGCVDTATSGTVELLGQETRGLSERALTRLRLESIGFIFQSFNLIEVLDVLQNVELPLLLQRRYSKAQRRQRVEAVVERVGLSEQRKQRPGALSGGQRQRVAIARALVTRPALVLADEPTANLDSATGGRVLDLMQALNAEEGISFLFSTHDPSIMSKAHRLIQISDGRIRQPS